MLSESQLEEIREHLERAQNPVFYYDNDADGLCSFVLLRKFLGRGKGVAIRSFPELSVNYVKKTQELNADYVFILDKPVITKEFFEEVDRIGLPVVWIDHHDLPISDFEKDFKNLFVYNPSRNLDKSSEPTTFISYQVTKRKEDEWLAIVGCISDHYLPDFAKDFSKDYPDFWGKVKDPFDAYYKTSIGSIGQAINFGLKDSVSNVVRLQNFLISCKSPEEVLSEVSLNHSLRKKYQEVKGKYSVLLEKAKKLSREKIIFFDYSGEMSMSADLSNELCYLYPEKYVVVSYKKGGISNISIRGKGVKSILEQVLKEVEGGGGGHEDAVGARVPTEKLDVFKEIFERVVKNK